MRLNQVNFSNAKPVDGYGPGFFRIGGAVVTGAVLVSEAGFAPWGGYDDAKALLALAGQIDVILVGTGAEIAPLPADLRRALEEAGLGVEIMNSPAAARTYNVLMAEGRRVAAAMLPV
ncbi:Mth938-like domain-containing protein [Actibacterium sp. XHP0104]|uniref:Mth938-like domain-containing protein n=1 Tax=Actibacterium sp. XHP0104 TaxID=2984335 RepID=UPI0021E90B6D|nr:Mth938-like domain-containing protein [Actibacterium sp. XHP0104]MCV2880911.1 Mth938-like domain-containing protein [Actibacterium sp. XHP0104]